METALDLDDSLDHRVFADVVAGEVVEYHNPSQFVRSGEGEEVIVLRRLILPDALHEIPRRHHRVLVELVTTGHFSASLVGVEHRHRKLRRLSQRRR